MTAHGLTLHSIVVCYNPDPEILHLIQVLSDQSDAVVLVDNSPYPSPLLKSHESSSVSTMVLGQNRGLAFALNIGVQKAKNDGATWVLLWDQDSRPTADTILQMKTAISGSWNERTLWSASAIDRTISHDARKEPYRVTRAITSGLAIPMHIFEEVGQFREDFLVDLVDFDFSFRATVRGIKIYRVPAAKFAHKLGDPEAGRTRFKYFSSSGHPPWRNYWIARNSSILIAEHRATQPAAIRLLRKDRLYWFMGTLVAGPKRVQNVRALLLGLAHARVGRTSRKYSRFFSTD